MTLSRANSDDTFSSLLLHCQCFYVCAWNPPHNPSLWRRSSLGHCTCVDFILKLETYLNVVVDANDQENSVPSSSRLDVNRMNFVVYKSEIHSSSVYRWLDDWTWFGLEVFFHRVDVRDTWHCLIRSSHVKIIPFTRRSRYIVKDQNVHSSWKFEACLCCKCWKLLRPWKFILDRILSWFFRLSVLRCTCGLLVLASSSTVLDTRFE